MSKMIEKSSSPPRRVQIDFAESEMEEIDELVQKCGLATKKDLFNNALTILRWAVRQVESGHDVAAIDRNSERFLILTMPILDAAQRRTASTKNPPPATSVAEQPVPAHRRRRKASFAGV
jgi:hypothetical protein